jgi:hypothetical protein
MAGERFLADDALARRCGCQDGLLVHVGRRAGVQHIDVLQHRIRAVEHGNAVLASEVLTALRTQRGCGRKLHVHAIEPAQTLDVIPAGKAGSNESDAPFPHCPLLALALCWNSASVKQT